MDRLAQVFERAADENRKAEEQALQTSISFHDYGSVTKDSTVPVQEESMEGKENHKGVQTDLTMEDISGYERGRNILR